MYCYLSTLVSVCWQQPTARDSVWLPCCHQEVTDTKKAPECCLSAAPHQCIWHSPGFYKWDLWNSWPYYQLSFGLIGHNTTRDPQQPHHLHPGALPPITNSWQWSNCGCLWWHNLQWSVYYWCYKLPFTPLQLLHIFTWYFFDWFGLHFYMWWRDCSNKLHSPQDSNSLFRPLWTLGVLQHPRRHWVYRIKHFQHPTGSYSGTECGSVRWQWSGGVQTGLHDCGSYRWGVNSISKCHYITEWTRPLAVI